MARPSGSSAATEGFRNEFEIENAFNAGRSFATECYSYMGIANSASVTAVTIPSRLGKDSAKELFGLLTIPTSDELRNYTHLQKADTLLKIDGDTRKLIRLSLKKANARANFNQADRRSIGDYQKMWRFDDYIRRWLDIFTGAAPNAIFHAMTRGLRVDSRHRRVVFKDLPPEAKQAILEFFEFNKHRIVTDVVRGQGKLAADYLMVTQHNRGSIQVRLCAINDALDHLLIGPIEPSSQGGSIRLGRLTIQRYGGNPHPEYLQFKMKPLDLFDANVKGLTLS